MDETARLVAEAGGKFVGLKSDVRDAAAVNKVIEPALGEFGKVDYLLANAGIYTTGPMATMSDQMFDDVVRTNLYGVFNMMRANASGPQGVPWVEPEDVTAAVLFLLSNEARHITGVALDVAAGGSASVMA